MNLSFGGSSIPVSALNSFDTIAILLLVPLFDGFVYPYFKKIGRPLKLLDKMGLGFCFSLLAMLIAGFVVSRVFLFADVLFAWFSSDFNRKY
jgi:dipeptide/tripeptide permease